MKRALRILGWLAPMAFFLWWYRFALRTWFLQDDFAWLGLWLGVHSWRDLPATLFTPQAQGTIRPLSERLFFLAFTETFWLNARPFHYWVAATQMASLALLHSIVYRLTRSRLAAAGAPIVWLAGVGLATPIAWLSSYNQVLCSFFLLAAFRCLLAAIETGQRKWWVLQWMCFLLGFGALEINIVYPALAAGYAFLFARQHLRRTLWLAPVSCVYFVVHTVAAPKPTEGLYAQHWDWSMWGTYWSYWGTALAGGTNVWNVTTTPWPWEAVAAGLGIALAAAAAWCWRQGERLPVFGAFWFTAAIGPVLPLRDHVSNYYLVAPTIGLALIFAELFRRAGLGRHGWTVALAFLLMFHLDYSLAANWSTTRWTYDRGVASRVLVLGLERAQELHPGKLILLMGVDQDLFWSALGDNPGRLFGANEVYLIPGEEQRFGWRAEYGSIEGRIAPKGLVGRALANGDAVVYQFEPGRLRNVTSRYKVRVPKEWVSLRPLSIDVSRSLYDRDLGTGWYGAEPGWRWMGKEATVFLAGPPAPGRQLAIAGDCPAKYGAEPPRMKVLIGDETVWEQRLPRSGARFEISAPIPDSYVGRSEMAVKIRLDRTLPGEPDSHPLGLVFGQFTVR